DEAERLAGKIETELAATRAVAATVSSWRYAYLIWRDPWMAAGTDTFISAMIGEAGGRNVLEGRYPSLTLEDLLALAPDMVFLPSEPYPFAEAHLDELIGAGFGDGRLRLVDGEFLSWHGVRLLEGLPYLRTL
ncbi:MAG TPA: helical backbone metal receptor, partial [Ardenticatenaceae bacterium]|nr:helical backbone metal receptor [Ardenticatenaceae bacterium]